MATADVTVQPGATRAPAGLVTRRPGLAVAALSSIGAGAIHAAATGIHAEHPTLARLFVAIAIAQLAAGIIALARPTALAAAGVAVVNAAAVGGWLATRLIGIGWIDGLEVREAAQFADSACALLGAVAAGAALAALLAGRISAPPPRLALSGVIVAALAVPAMVSGGTHVHSHTDDAGAAAGHGHDDPSGGAAGALAPSGTEAADHTHDESAPTGTDGAAPGTSVDHTHDAATSTWPRPWDPTQPLDLSGVPGVTAEQEARATTLVEGSLRELARYADVDDAIADGYQSIGDAATGSEHYIKLAYVQDDVLLDPTQPESLVYTVNGDERILAGAMYIASARSTDDPELVGWAGPLMQWHNHGNLCWDLDETGKPAVVGVVRDDGTCARGVNTGGANPMVHVWVTPHPCGVFAALEGVGAGQAAVPDDQRADMCHADHGHSDEAAAPVTKPYDPTQPIDLGGVEGVTPEQQAAAENLVAITLVRLPQWSDPAVAEAAGFHSIGDAATGFEHYIQWDWIDDDVILDPDHPESLVYRPQADGSKQLVSAMFMLPRSVDLDEVPDIGGALMQWHIHDNLCFTTGDAPKVGGITDAEGTCHAPLVAHDPSAMIHVWIVPHQCGPFAALEGLGAGQIADGETRLCDHAHGSS